MIRNKSADESDAFHRFFVMLDEFRKESVWQFIRLTMHSDPGYRARGRVCEIPMLFVGIAINVSVGPGRWVVRPFRTIMPLRAFMFLITVSLLIGCQARHLSLPASTEQRERLFLDEQQFAKIVDYYRKTWPRVTFPSGDNIHSVSGASGERLHINVPVAVDAEFQHPYAPEFLAKQFTNSDGLTRMIAAELLLLRNEKLFTRPSRHSYDAGALVDCISYVVKVDPSR